jgi:hypothetical protein
MYTYKYDFINLLESCMVSNIYLAHFMPNKRDTTIQKDYLHVVSINNEIIDPLIVIIDFDFGSI